MARKRTVVRVGITNQKCQTEIMTAVAKLDGVEKIEVDPRRGTVTIVGEVEPVAIFKKLTKIGKTPEIVSVGPPLTLTSTSTSTCTCSLCHRPYVKQRFPPPYPSQHHHIPHSYSTQCEVVDLSYPAAYSGDTEQCCIL